MQFVLVPLLASAASPLTVAVKTLFVYSRHIFYGLSFIEFDQSYWIIGSVIGALLGQVLPFDFTCIDKSGRCRLSLKKSPTNCRLLLLLSWLSTA